MHRNNRIRQIRLPTFPIILLLFQIFETISNYGIPIITAIFAAVQIGVFIRYIQVPWKTAWDVCLSVEKMSFDADKIRLFMNAFEHGDDWHLYYNMVSFLWKGRELEMCLGSIRFLVILMMFVILTSCTYLGMNLFLFYLTSYEWYLKSCAVGFSSVIFALKVLTTHYTCSSNNQTFMGISVPSKYTYWIELIIIQIIAPEASLIGHLSGILVGLLYVTGPLRKPLDFVEGMIGLDFINQEINNTSK